MFHDEPAILASLQLGYRIELTSSHKHWMTQENLSIQLTAIILITLKLTFYDYERAECGRLPIERREELNHKL